MRINVSFLVTPSFKILSFITLLVTQSNLSFNAIANELGSKHFKQCIVCHGESGQGNKALKSPALAGQSDWYIARQLENFNKKHRGTHSKDVAGQQMAAIVSPVDFSNKINSLSKYISTLPTYKENSPTAKSISKETLKNGSRYYQGKCGACHGATAQGNKLFNAPKLNTLSEAYLLKQMNNFVQGIRGTHKEDKYGRQMAMMAKTTSGTELQDIIAYISYLGTTGH